MGGYPKNMHGSARGWNLSQCEVIFWANRDNQKLTSDCIRVDELENGDIEPHWECVDVFVQLHHFVKVSPHKYIHVKCHVRKKKFVWSVQGTLDHYLCEYGEFLH